MKENKPGFRISISKITSIGAKFRPYLLLGFIVFVFLLYGFLMLRLNTLLNTQPSDSDVAQQIDTAKVPHIDETVVKQLESLQDNSVRVKSLFQDARNNPFQ